MAERVVLSGFTQRRDKATGQMADDYLYTVRVDRAAWAAIDFSQEGLAALDVVEALSRFDLARNMSTTGIFRPVAPLSADQEMLALTASNASAPR